MLSCTLSYLSITTFQQEDIVSLHLDQEASENYLDQASSESQRAGVRTRGL